MSRLPLSMQSSQMYDPSSPLMSRPSSLDFLPQNEQDGSSLLWLGILPRWTGFPCNANLGDDLVYDAILHRLFGRHEEVSFGISSHNLKRFSRMGGKNLAHRLLDPQNLFGLNFNVRRLSLCPTPGLVDHNTRVRQRKSLSLASGSKKNGGEACRLSQTDGGHRSVDVLHGIIDRHARSDFATNAVDIEIDVFGATFSCQIEHFGNNQVRDLCIDLSAEEYNTILQQPGIDIVATLSMHRLFDYVRNGAHCTSCLASESSFN